jgi:hypothetical protein
LWIGPSPIRKVGVPRTGGVSSIQENSTSRASPKTLLAAGVDANNQDAPMSSLEFLHVH